MFAVAWKQFVDLEMESLSISGLIYHLQTEIVINLKFNFSSKE